MAMVFAADGEKHGLKSRHKLLLLAYANHTDAHGYCHPGIDRLMHETGMSESSVQQVNVQLRKMGLIKAVKRYSRKTKRQTTNLTRLNLPLLASMRREETSYDDNLIEEITFGPEDLGLDADGDHDTGIGESSQVNEGSRSHTPRGPDLTPQGSRPHTPGGPESGPKTSQGTSVEPPPSGPPSHTGTEGAGPAPSARGEGEISQGDERTGGASVPRPRSAPDCRDQGAESEDRRLVGARAVLAGLPAPLTPGRRTVAELAPLVAEAFRDGWTAESVAAYVLADLPDEIKSPRGYLIHKVKDLPPSPPITASVQIERAPHCGDPRCFSGRIEGEGGAILGRCPSWPHSIDPATAIAPETAKEAV